MVILYNDDNVFTPGVPEVRRGYEGAGEALTLQMCMYIYIYICLCAITIYIYIYIYIVLYTTDND